MILVQGNSRTECFGQVVFRISHFQFCGFFHMIQALYFCRISCCRLGINHTLDICNLVMCGHGGFRCRYGNIQIPAKFRRQYIFALYIDDQTLVKINIITDFLIFYIFLSGIRIDISIGNTLAQIRTVEIIFRS